MKDNNHWFALYPNKPFATNLSILSGGIKLLSILLLIASVICTAAVLAVSIRFITLSGTANAILFLIDEFDEMFVIIFMLWCAVFILRYIASALRAKASIMGTQAQEVSAENRQ